MTLTGYTIEIDDDGYMHMTAEGDLETLEALRDAVRENEPDLIVGEIEPKP